MAIIANKTVVLSNKKLDTIEPQPKQKEIKAQPLEIKKPQPKKKEIKARIEPEALAIENHTPSDEKGFLVRKPSQFMHDMLNEQNKQE